MMLCEKCGTDILIKYGSGRFCSAKCARSFATSKDREGINKKVSEKLKGRKLWSRPDSFRLAENARKVRMKRLQKTWETEEIQNLSDFARRTRILKEQDNQCFVCHLSSWNGSFLKLQLDHIDGNRSNNKRENLRMICPNCHSQTENYCGKSKNTSKELSDEIVSSCLIRNSFNISQTLKELNLAYGGSNWHRCHRLLFEMKTLDKVKQCSENGSVTQRD